MESDADKLASAAAKGEDAKVKRLLKANADVNGTVTRAYHSAHVSGITALQFACATGNLASSTWG